MAVSLSGVRWSVALLLHLRRLSFRVFRFRLVILQAAFDFLVMAVRADVVVLALHPETLEVPLFTVLACFTLDKGLIVIKYL